MDALVRPVFQAFSWSDEGVQPTKCYHDLVSSLCERAKSFVHERQLRTASIRFRARRRSKRFHTL